MPDLFSSCRAHLLAVATAVGALAATPGAHAQAAPQPGTAEQPAAELAGRAAETMARLEETMDRLARLLEVDEPENALRLREAYGRARETFLTESMSEIAKLLATHDLEGALSEHGKANALLDELLRILTGEALADEDLAEEIARLEAIEKELAEHEKIERELEARSQALAKSAAARAAEAGGESPPAEGEPKPEEDSEAAAKEAQDEQQAKTKELAAKMAAGAKPTPGAAEASSAAGAMGEASESLGEGEPGKAAPEQDEAADQLAKAREQVAKEIKALKNKLQSRALAELAETFKAMLEAQRALTASTADVEARRVAEAEGKLGRADAITVGKLARGEDELEAQAVDAREVLEEEGTSVVFPRAVRMLEEYLAEAERRLDSKETGASTHVAQTEAERILEEMIAAVDREREVRQSKGCGT